jgi:hypothetical protein
LIRVRCVWGALAATAWWTSGCSEQSAFPNQIPDIVAALGKFHTALSERDRVRFDSVCADRELYNELVAVLGDDSLAVLSRRIHNPIDSAHVMMTVALVRRQIDISWNCSCTGKGDAIGSWRIA